MLRAFCTLLLATFGASDPSQQTTTTPARETTAARDSSSVARERQTAGTPLPTPGARSDSTLRIDGRLWLANGEPARGALITAMSVSGVQHQHVGHSDTTGQFSIPVPTGTYRLTMKAPRGDSAVVDSLVVNGATRMDGVLTLPPENPSPLKEWPLTGAVLLLYALALLFARWNHIARSVHAMLDRQITALETRLETEAEPRDGTKTLALRNAVKKLREDFDPLRDNHPSFHQFFFWSRGKENSTWVVIHEIERQMTAFLAPREQVDVYLQSAAVELRTLNKTVASGVADAIATELALTRPSDKTDPEGTASRDLSRKALLGRATAIIYDERDKDFSTLMEWQNKTGWLILVAIIIMGSLVVSAGHAVLLLAGAAGGLMSRLARALRSADLPLDYGASWTTLWLSPLLGALAGWFGIALIEVATSPSLNLLGSAFRLVDWNHPTGAPTLAVAFVLGFSERLFDAIIGAVDKHNEGEARDERVARANLPARLPGGPAPGAQQQGGGAAPPPAPQITDAKRSTQPQAAGKALEVLVLSGTGFISGAQVTVNDDKHSATFGSDTSITLPLSDAEITAIEQARKLDIVVTNPNGAASNSYKFPP